MAGFGAQNTSTSVVSNAVDASQWPASFDAPLTAPATPGAYWSADLLYPSANCNDRPAWSPSQVTSMLSNLGGLTQCLADYVAKANNATVVIPAANEAGSWTATGKFMCDALTAIDAKIAAIGGSYVGVAAPPIVIDTVIPTEYYGATNTTRLGTPVKWFPVVIDGITYRSPAYL